MNIRNTIIAVAFALLVSPAVFAQKTEVFFGQDTGAGPTGRAHYPESLRVFEDFKTRCVNVLEVGFEDLGDKYEFKQWGTKGEMQYSYLHMLDNKKIEMNFGGSETATLTGMSYVARVTNKKATQGGAFPISGETTVVLNAKSGDVNATITFDKAQAAFGFYVTDIEKNRLSLALIRNGQEDEPIEFENMTLPAENGGICFVGVINKSKPFEGVRLINPGGSNEGFGFDDMVIAKPMQIQPPQAPSVEVKSHVNFTNEPIALYKEVRLTNFPNRINKATVHLQGYKNGDELIVTDTGNITAKFDSEKGLLTLEGEGTPTDYQNILHRVKFKSDPTSAGARTAVFTAGPGVALKVDGHNHYYEYINEKLTWTEAKRRAEQRKYLGVIPGYLATITSAVEQEFVKDKVHGDGWIGASDHGDEEGAWKWRTGPEAGMELAYTNWATGEPNQQGNEDYANFFAKSGKWNDWPNNGANKVQGYFVEYGGPKFKLNVTASVTVNVGVGGVSTSATQPKLND